MICDKLTGQCMCKAGFAGTDCNVCRSNVEGYYCEKCERGIYRWPNCNQGKWAVILRSNIIILNKNSLTECDCNTIGSKGISCDDFGQCECLDNYKGSKCDECADGYYDTNQKCIGM